MLALFPHVVPLAFDWFGNRVVQALIECLPRVGPDADLYASMIDRLLSCKAEMEKNKYAAFVLKKLNVIQGGSNREMQMQMQNVGHAASEVIKDTCLHRECSTSSIRCLMALTTMITSTFRMPIRSLTLTLGHGSASMFPLDANSSIFPGSHQVSNHSTPNYPSNNPTVYNAGICINCRQMDGLD